MAGGSTLIVRPVVGTVVANGSSGRRCEVAIAAHGTFTMHLVAGTYTFTGHSPSFGGGKYTCTDGAALTLTDRPTNSQGPIPVVTLVCPMR